MGFWEELAERAAVNGDISAERDRQDAKWGPQRNLPWPTWITILTEEVGEAAEEALGGKDGTNVDTIALRAELIQVAAVAVAAIEDLDTR